ncbi:MAG: hypothetical protein U0892_17145 [Pirellulales bacterium]
MMQPSPRKTDLTPGSLYVKASVENDYYSNGLLKSVKRKSDKIDTDVRYGSQSTLHYDATGRLESQDTTYVRLRTEQFTETSPSAAPGNRLQQDETFQYKYDGEGNLVERAARANSIVIDDSDTARVEYPWNVMGFSTQSGRTSASNSTAPTQHYGGNLQSASAIVTFGEVNAGVYDIWSTWQESSSLGTGMYEVDLNDLATRQDLQTGFLRAKIAVPYRETELIHVNFAQPPNSDAPWSIHSDGLPWFPVATVQVDGPVFLSCCWRTQAAKLPSTGLN